MGSRLFFVHLVFYWKLSFNHLSRCGLRENQLDNRACGDHAQGPGRGIRHFLQRVDVVGGCPQNQDSDRSPRHALLVGYALIDSEQNIVTSFFRQPKQVSVLPATKPGKPCAMHFMTRKLAAESLRHAPVQQDLHAIRATSESFASSSAWTAMVWLTVGKSSRNSDKG